MKTPVYTINDFRNEYPTDDICLDKILELRLNKMPCCPQCSQETSFKRVKGRRCYQCSDKDCQYQLYPTVGTVFEKTRTRMSDIFYVIYLMVSTRNGVSGMEIQRQLGGSYERAWSLGHRIREIMGTSEFDILSGVVEIDEKYHGMQTKNKHKSIRDELKDNNKQWLDKTPIMTLVVRGSGNIVTQVLLNPKPSISDIQPVINRWVEKGSVVITDGLHAYKWAKNDYVHEIVNHAQDEFKRGKFHTNTVEGFFSHLERCFWGTHIHVSVKYLPSYLGECEFRYKHRKKGQLMFEEIINRIAA